LIHELRFSAVWPQETIAYLPLPPIAFSSASVSPCPMPSAVAWLTKTSRTEFGASVSDVATWMPAALACCSSGAIESGSLGATINASTFCWM
jgi:alkanesulfonate monooxygenase SsuD/methylene tetrahydromethanopterin reductase-like flavin-dependent oxidoreductase (luciferase family)